MPHPRFLALLARRSIRCRPKPSEFRQTIRARLSRNARLEQTSSRSETARRDHREDRREISRSIREINRRAAKGKLTAQQIRDHRLLFLQLCDRRVELPFPEFVQWHVLHDIPFAAARANRER